MVNFGKTPGMDQLSRDIKGKRDGGASSVIMQYV